MVVEDGRAYFHDDADVCPNHKAYCQKRAYVVPGDRLLTSGSQDGYTCVFVPSKSTTTTGWIETKRLKPATLNLSPPPAGWEGIWDSEATMHIKVIHDQRGLRASGLTEWASGDGYDERGKLILPGHEHHGEFSGKLAATGLHAHLQNGECAIDFALLNEFLVVIDDGNSCSDPDTSFRGIYRHRP